MDQDLKNSIVQTGTTIIGIVCKNGIIMASDKQASAGSMVMSKYEQKIYPVKDYLLVSGCGMAAEIQRIPKYLSAELRLKELRSRSRPTVKQAANLLSNLIASRQQAGFLISGFNEDGSVELYSMDPVGHISKVKDYDANFGSGMPFVLGLLERQFKKDMTIKEGIELAKEALKSSTQRDMGSGYGIDIFSITKEGIKKEVAEKL
jgi:proteasome beta subunit